MQFVSRCVRVLALAVLLVAIGSSFSSATVRQRQTGTSETPANPPVISSVTVNVTIDDSLNGAWIEQTIHVTPGDPSRQKIILSAAPFAEANISDVQVNVNGREDLYPIVKNTDGLWQVDTGLQLPDTSEEIRFAISYRVSSEPSQLSLPLIYLPWKPANETRTDRFHALVSMPNTVRVLDSFPAQETLVSSEHQTGNVSKVEFQLSSIPSVLCLKLVDKESTVRSTGQLIDIGVLLCLCLLAVIGWRYRRWII